VLAQRGSQEKEENMPATEWIVVKGPSRAEVMAALNDPPNHLVFRFVIQPKNGPKGNVFEFNLEITHLVASITKTKGVPDDWCGSLCLEGLLVDSCPILTAGNIHLIATVRIFYDLGKPEGTLEVIKVD